MIAMSCIIYIILGTKHIFSNDQSCRSVVDEQSIAGEGVDEHEGMFLSGSDSEEDMSVD